MSQHEKASLFDQESSGLLMSGSMVKLRSAKGLLLDPYCQEQRELIKKYLKVDAELWSLMFNPFLERFAEYVQLFPDARSNNRPILFVALMRTASAMESMPNHADERYRFALFTASLLLHLGVVFTDYRIVRTNDQGKFIEDWSPFSGILFQEGPYCRLYPVSNIPSQLVAATTPVLAQVLMDKGGWHWLSEEPNLLHQWLAFLGRGKDTGELGILLDMADKKAQLESASMPAMPIESMCLEQNLMGEVFWRWIKERVDENKLQVNQKDALIHRTDVGVVLDIEALARAYCKEKKQSNWQQLVEQIEAMGLLRQDNSDYRFEKKHVGAAKERAQSALGARGLFSTKAEDNKRLAISQNAAVIQGRVLRYEEVLKVPNTKSESLSVVKSPAIAARLDEFCKSMGHSLTQQLSNREGK